MNDPLLVFNMAIFNVDDGWSRTFSPLKIHENGSVTNAEDGHGIV